MKRLATLTAVSLVMGVGLLTGTAQALETKIVVVDCATQSLQALLDSVPTKPDFAAVIVIKGTCAEDVTLEFDDVTFTGHPTVGGAISGSLTIEGARGVEIDDLTVTGPGWGIHGTDGASFTVENSDISNNEMRGIVVSNGSSATIFNNTIHDNGVDPLLDFATGIMVMDGAFASISDNDIQNSLFSGVFVNTNAAARLEGNTINNSGLTTEDCGITARFSGSVVLIGGNTITNSGFAAICVDLASEFNQHLGGVQVPDTIVQRGCPQSCVPGTWAVRAQEHSKALFQNANITGGIDVSALSSFSANGGGSITGDISVNVASGVSVIDPVSFTGTLTCGGGGFSYGAVQCGQTCSGDVPETCVP